MTSLDWSIFGLYFAGVLGVAWWQSRRNVGVEGYFLANRRLPWYAIGLSVMATQASAITFIGTTGQAYDDGMEFIQVYLGLPLAMVLICIIFVPFFYRAKLYTAYEYLERRFDPKTRSLAAFLFLIQRSMGAGLIMYAPAIVLSVIMGWDETVTILIMAGVTIAYTAMGGITAVIWTDVIQMLMMFGGIIVALVVLFVNLPAGVGVSDLVYLGGVQRMWTTVDPSFNLDNTYTIWSGVLGGMFLALAYFGTDQSQVQRYLTARSLKDSRLSLIFTAFLKVPMQFAILSIGVLLFVFFHFQRPPLIFNAAEYQAVESSAHAGDLRALEQQQAAIHTQRREVAFRLLDERHRRTDVAVDTRALARYDEQLAGLRRQAKELVTDVRGEASNDDNYVFPAYLVRYVPTGILGLMIAVIFAAAMSSIDSEITALSSAFVVDFYRRWVRQQASDSHYLAVSRVATVGFGMLACLVALQAGRLGSLIEAVNQIGSFFYGSLLGVFLLAFLVKRANGTGAFVGLIAGMAVVAVVGFTTGVSFLWYNVIGAAVVLAVGSTVSALTPAR